MSKLLVTVAVLIFGLPRGIANAQSMPDQHAAPQCEAVLIVVDQPQTAITPLAGPLAMNLTFGQGITQARRIILQRAIDEWQAIIQDSGNTPGNYPVTMSFGPRPDGNLATTSVTSTNAGNLISATIIFSDSAVFFEDPSPADDSKFDPGCQPPACQPPPPGSWDLLTVARHELGHALGWTQTRGVADLLSGDNFDVPRLNIPTVTVGCAPAGAHCHTDPSWIASDVMVPSLPPVTRYSISNYPGASLVARAYNYRIPMEYVDPTFTGAEIGTAQQPWRTMSVACGTFSTLPTPLLLANVTHLVTPGFRCVNRRIITAARGGASVRP